MSKPIERTRWLAVAAALGAGVVASLYIGKMPVALPLLRTDFGLSLIAAGWMVSLFNVIAGVGAIAIGLASGRVGAVLFCVAGQLLLAAGSVLGAYAHSGALMLFSRAVEGTGFVVVLVSAPALMIAATRLEQRALILGMWGLYFPVGIATALAASPFLLAGIGWQGLWLIGAAASLASAVWIYLRRHDYAGIALGAAPEPGAVAAAIRLPEPWLLSAAIAMFALQSYAFIAWLPTYLLQTRALSTTAAALFTAQVVAVGALGCMLGSWLAHRNVPRGLTVNVTLILLAGCAVGIFARGVSDPWRYAFALGYGFISGAIPATAFSGAARYARSSAEVGIVQGLLVQVTNLANLIGPPLTAAVVTFFGGWDAVLWLMLGSSAIGLIAGTTLSINERRARLR